MESLTTNTITALQETRWLHILKKLDAVAALLRSQGILEAKHQHGRQVWRVRYMDCESPRKRRTIYVGTDEVIVRRVQERLELYRGQHRWVKETVLLAKVALSVSARMLQRLLRPRQRRRSADSKKTE